jgi:hypothetical protein
VVSGRFLHGLGRVDGALCRLTVTWRGGRAGVWSTEARSGATPLPFGRGAQARSRKGAKRRSLAFVRFGFRGFDNVRGFVVCGFGLRGFDNLRGLF